MRENARGNSENHTSPTPIAARYGRSSGVGGSTASTTTGIDCERRVRAYAVITRATCIFSTSRFRRLCIPARKRNFLPIQFTGRNDPVPSRGTIRAWTRAPLRRERSIFLCSCKLTFSLARQFPVCLIVRHACRCEFFRVRATYRLLALHDIHCIDGYIVNARIIDKSTR